MISYTSNQEALFQSIGLTKEMDRERIIYDYIDNLQIDIRYGYKSNFEAKLALLNRVLEYPECPFSKDEFDQIDLTGRFSEEEEEKLDNFTSDFAKCSIEKIPEEDYQSKFPPRPKGFWIFAENPDLDRGEGVDDIGRFQHEAAQTILKAIAVFNRDVFSHDPRTLYEKLEVVIRKTQDWFSERAIFSSPEEEAKIVNGEQSFTKTHIERLNGCLRDDPTLHRYLLNNRNPSVQVNQSVFSEDPILVEEYRRVPPVVIDQSKSKPKPQQRPVVRDVEAADKVTFREKPVAEGTDFDYDDIPFVQPVEPKTVFDDNLIDSDIHRPRVGFEFRKF